MVNFPKILSHQLPSPGRGARPGGQRLLRLRAAGRAAAASASAAGGGTRSVLEPNFGESFGDFLNEVRQTDVKSLGFADMGGNGWYDLSKNLEVLLGLPDYYRLLVTTHPSYVSGLLSI